MTRMVNAISTYQVEEIENLRLIILSKYDPPPVTTILSDPIQLLEYIKSLRWVRLLLETPFKNLPTLVGKCPSNVHPIWFNSVVEWRLKYGC